MRHEVYWYTLKQPKPTPLAGTVSADVAIVGGGMMGLSCALRLQRQGLKVALVEKDFCGAGATGRSSGFITPDSELSLSLMLEKYGPEQACKLWKFAVEGLESMRQTIDDFALPCDYREDDSLYVAEQPGGFKSILREHEARRKLGFESRLYPASSMQSVVGSDKFYGGVRYGKTFSIDAYLYAQELKDVLIAAGVQIFEQSPVTRIDEGTVATAHGQVQAEHIVVCTDRNLPQLKIAPREIYSAQTFLALSAPLTDAQVQEIFPDGPCMVWDTDLIYQYFRLTSDRRLLIGASSLLYTYWPIRQRHSDLVEKKILSYWHKKFTNINLKLEYVWPGLIGVSKDFLPIAGAEKKRPKIFFGGGAAGLPWAAAIGMYLADKIVRNRSDFDLEFSPDRPSPLGGQVDKFLPKPLAFALAQGIVKLL